ncbi:hypothetical protein TRFO_07819 [Tritrichomonas foetus]|uniref:Tectonic domain-containing protein n=1 Tax=Tritrichomonas foetus TaxID=1144522 RepID=A0A1J4JTH5_9EUKA|nr:hypothetical protein TRFO_07819 [Tritrichomonas foetus]|eukprot:OHT00822.1 hypothetical protein TRFO_07819 [Tritrichomonas foetus]
MFFILPFFLSAVYRVIVSTTACTCDNTTGLCSAPCTINTTKPDRLPHCPSTPFQQSIPLVDWLLKEMFCVYKDHRNIQFESFNNQFIPDGVPINLSTDPFLMYESADQVINSSNYSYQSPIIGILASDPNTTNNRIFIPTPSATSVDCQFSTRPLEFFVSVKSSKCVYNSSAFNVSTIFPQYIEAFDQRVNVQLNDADAGADAPVRSMSYTFLYNETTQKVTNVSLYVTRYNKSALNDEMVTVEVDVMFYTNESQINSFKAGEFGYSFNQPVIVRRSNISANMNFPVPFGTDCLPLDQMEYTPLLFGEDTMSGCLMSASNENPASLLLNYTFISKLGQANPLFTQDWIPINRSEGVNETCPHLKLVISYEFIGNVNNPQNRIYAARFDCVQSQSPFFVFSAEFLRTADNNAFRYLQPNPRVKGIPDDTFYPIVRR